MEIATSLIETLKRMSQIFYEAKIPFCLIGGLAVGILAKPRATEDIDLLALIDENNIDFVGKLIKDHFQVIQDDNIMHFEHAAIWRIVVQDEFSDDRGLVIIDIVFADNELFKKAVSEVIILKIDGTDIPVIKKEYLIEMKQLSNRATDQIDIQALLEGGN